MTLSIQGVYKVQERTSDKPVRLEKVQIGSTTLLPVRFDGPMNFADTVMFIPIWLVIRLGPQHMIYPDLETRYVFVTRMPPVATKSKYGKNL